MNRSSGRRRGNVIDPAALRAISCRRRKVDPTGEAEVDRLAEVVLPAFREGPAGVTIGPVQWPAPEAIPYFGLMTFGQ